MEFGVADDSVEIDLNNRKSETRSDMKRFDIAREVCHCATGDCDGRWLYFGLVYLARGLGSADIRKSTTSSRSRSAICAPRSRAPNGTQRAELSVRCSFGIIVQQLTSAIIITLVIIGVALSTVGAKPAADPVPPKPAPTMVDIAVGPDPLDEHEAHLRDAEEHLERLLGEHELRRRKEAAADRAATDAGVGASTRRI